MIIKNKVVQVGFLASMLLPAIVGYSVVTVQALEANSDAALCQIEATQQGNTFLVKATVEAEHAGLGRYQFGISNGTGINITQGGEFLTSNGEQQTLSQVVVSKGQAAYNANLHIIFDDQVAECQEIIK
ncbi:curli-like amyloid fiber formation chaperone CsgH [Lentilitoribacter sp. EG35]|jgi:hypothetical protein|uniref:curli-like amyloid fiber formation chaperone CsgH n=1 Tax=Lentilitoribacter sp. EG35 TaxID=3234192 RepID=UPI003460121C